MRLVTSASASPTPSMAVVLVLGARPERAGFLERAQARSRPTPRAERATRGEP